jgi:hypothetical protein
MPRATPCSLLVAWRWAASSNAFLDAEGNWTSFVASLALLQLGWFVHDGLDAKRREPELRQAEERLKL